MNGARKGREAPDLADILRLEEIFRHVEDKQRLHPVIGKALPNLRHGKPAEPRGMPDERCPGFRAFLELFQRRTQSRTAFDFRGHGEVFAVLGVWRVHPCPILLVV